jgi:type I restriction enzyme, S subunit
VTPRRVRVGDVLELERRPVEPEPTKEYVSIGIRSFGKGIFHYEPIQSDQLGKLRFFKVVPDRLIVSNIKG